MKAVTKASDYDRYPDLREWERGFDAARTEGVWDVPTDKVVAPGSQETKGHKLLTRTAIGLTIGTVLIGAVAVVNNAFDNDPSMTVPERVNGAEISQQIQQDQLSTDVQNDIARRHGGLSPEPAQEK